MISVDVTRRAQDIIRDALHERDPQRNVADVSPMLGLEMIQQTMHKGNGLTPDGAQFALCLMGVEHDHQMTLQVDYPNEPAELPPVFDPSRHTEFAEAVFKAVDLPEDEVVRFIIIAWRMPDFSLQTIAMEPDGVFHDSITAPVFGTALGTTMTVADVIVDFTSSLARQYWGRYWVASRCHHNKRPPEGSNPIFMEMPDDDD